MIKSKGERHHDHIPFELKRNGNIVFSVHSTATAHQCLHLLARDWSKWVHFISRYFLFKSGHLKRSPGQSDIQSCTLYGRVTTNSLYLQFSNLFRKYRQNYAWYQIYGKQMIRSYYFQFDKSQIIVNYSHRNTYENTYPGKVTFKVEIFFSRVTTTHCIHNFPIDSEMQMKIVVPNQSRIIDSIIMISI